MTIYSYPDSKVIDEITFKKTPNGGVRAYLHVRDDTDLAVVHAAIEVLKSSNYECVPFTLGEKPTLEVRGFGDEKKLLSMLSKNKWVENKAVLKEEEGDQVSWKEWLSKRTLQASGLAYIVGDYGFITHGVKDKDKLVVAGAISYFLGTLSLIFYGRNDQSDLQVQDLAKELEKYLERENIKIPDGSAMHEIAKDKPKSLLQTFNDFGRKYPSEIFNSVTALAGVFVAIGAIKNKVLKPTAGMDAKAISATRKIGWMDFGLGSATTAAGIFGTVVKEKKHDPDSPPKTGLAWVWEKMREHPLAVTGAGYTVATMCHAYSTLKDWGEHKRLGKNMSSVYSRGLFVAMALLSEFLLSISSKGHGEGVVIDESVDTSVIAMAAELIVRQPVEQQEKLIEQMGKFLGQQEALAMEDNKVLASLRKQVEMLHNNPWARAGSYKATEAESSADAPAALTNMDTVWQSKMTARETATPQAQFAI